MELGWRRSFRFAKDVKNVLLRAQDGANGVAGGLVMEAENEAKKFQQTGNFSPPDRSGWGQNQKERVNFTPP